MLKRWVGGTKEEYENQFYGFGCQAMQLSLRRMVKNCVVSSVQDLEHHLIGVMDLNDTDKVALNKSSGILIKLMMKRAEDPVRSLDDHIEKLFSIPENVLLPCDEDQKLIPKNEFQEMQSELEELRKRAKRASLMEKLLSKELKELESLDQNCHLEIINFIDLWSNKLSDKKENEVMDEMTKLASKASKINNLDLLDGNF